MHPPSRPVHDHRGGLWDGEGRLDRATTVDRRRAPRVAGRPRRCRRPGAAIHLNPRRQRGGGRAARYAGRLGFAVQLAPLRHPGTTLARLYRAPGALVAWPSGQPGVPAALGLRPPTEEARALFASCVGLLHGVVWAARCVPRTPVLFPPEAPHARRRWAAVAGRPDTPIRAPVGGRRLARAAEPRGKRAWGRAAWSLTPAEGWWSGRTERTGLVVGPLRPGEPAGVRAALPRDPPREITAPSWRLSRRLPRC